MGSSTTQVLAYALAAAASPIPIIGVILILATPRAQSNSLALLAGWLAGFIGVGAIVLLVSSGSGYDADDSGTDPLRIALGVLLLLLALKQWRKRPKDGEASDLPGWMRAVDGFDARRSAALGFALAAINPKNLLLLVAGASAIASSGDSGGGQIAALLIFTVVASIGVATPIVVNAAAGERSEGLLIQMRGWLARNNSVILAVICALIGANLIVGGAG